LDVELITGEEPLCVEELFGQDCLDSITSTASLTARKME
jgi:hypothetical protein